MLWFPARCLMCLCRNCALRFRSQTEKVDLVEREKQRRNMGKEMAATREEMEKQRRMREYEQIRREKKAAALERDRLRAEIAKDKAERKSRGGTLASTLSVEGGYAPSGMSASIAAELNRADHASSELPPVKLATQSSPADAVDAAIASINKYKVRVRSAASAPSPSRWPHVGGRGGPMPCASDRRCCFLRDVCRWVATAPSASRCCSSSSRTLRRSRTNRSTASSAPSRRPSRPR